MKRCVNTTFGMGVKHDCLYISNNGLFAGLSSDSLDVIRLNTSRIGV